MKRLFAAAGLILVLSAAPARAEDPGRALFVAGRLACAYIQGINAVFTPQGKVSLKPPLDPNTPGLTIAIVDRERNRAVLEEDDRETPGVLMTTPSGLSVMARYPDGGVTMVTVFPVYSGASDNFIMVSSRHGAGNEPQLSQRYGFCRPGVEPPPPPAPTPKGHS
ncbi:MAG: hypothetical protein ACLGQH_05650 [Acidobacteriota bacterium]